MVGALGALWRLLCSSSLCACAHIFPPSPHFLPDGVVAVLLVPSSVALQVVDVEWLTVGVVVALWFFMPP